jgi:hypothetical protein
MATAVASLTYAQTGSIGFTDAGSPSANNTDISQATAFTIGDLQSQTGSSLRNVFAGSIALNNGGAGLDFGPVSFSLSGPTSDLDFANSVFGIFDCQQIYVIGSIPGALIDVRAVGTYTSGSWDFDAIQGEAASIDIVFSQNGVGSALSDSGSFSIPAVPEPGSVALLGMGATGLCVYLRRRKA